MLILAELTNKPNKFLTFLKFALKIIFYYISGGFENVHKLHNTQ